MNNDELIALYISGKLTEEQQIEFDRLVKNDEDFANEVKFHEDLKVVATKEAHDTVKSELITIEENLANTKTFSKTWLVAASIALIATLSGYWMFKNNDVNHQDLYSEYFQPYRNVVQPIVRGDNSKDLKYSAFKAYEAKEYTVALNLFDSLLQTTHDASISFYKANALMQLNEHDKAISILESHLDLGNNLADKKNWYLALAYLNTNRPEQAKEQLRKLLATTSQFKRKEAQKLLKKIE
ncbi:hypothetical protein [Winogradskyella sp. 3972H.M.0a.05]|uniref:tetratricopeptide repeat protein n=1 Tax=Winogradskyella sp. 3972H.M.0a.05 TaxID=2950277 RepID=UPI003393BF4C